MSRHISLYSFLQALVISVYVALITFLPSLNFMPNYITFHDSKRLVMLLLLALVLIYCTLNRQAICNQISVNQNVRNAFFVLLALACISTLLAKASRHAIIEISIFAALSYLALFVAGLYHENKEAFIRQITYATGVSVVLYLFAFYVGYTTACVFKTPLNWPSPFTGFNNIRSFNQYQLWLLGLVYLPLFTFELKQNTRYWIYIALACWWVLLFYSASRGAPLAWLAGMVVTALVYRKLALPFLRAQFFTMSAGFGGYYLLFKIMPNMLHTSLVARSIIRETTSDRTELWLKALILARNHPIFGVGPMNYPWYSFTMFHPHNSVLQLAAEWGFPATVIILSIAGFGFRCWFKKFNINNIQIASKLDRNLAIILLFTIISNGAYSLVDGVIVMPISQVLMFTIIGLMVGQYSHGQTANNSQRNFRFRPIFAGIVLVAMVWSTFPEIKQGLSGYENGFSTGSRVIGPRIWIQMSAPLKKSDPVGS
jgi:putative inorganic carbon (hco3(-)) transporter